MKKTFILEMLDKPLTKVVALLIITAFTLNKKGDWELSKTLLSLKYLNEKTTPTLNRADIMNLH